MKPGWKIKTLGDLAVKITDGSHNPPKGVEKSEYLMLSSQNVWNGYLDKSIARHLSKQDFLVEDKRTCAREGDVLLTIVGTIGRTCVLSREDTNITFQRSVCIIKPKPELNPFFLFYQLQFKNKEINEQANGAAQKGFYLKQVERLPLFITSLPEQQRIVDILDQEFAKIDALKANAEKSLQAAKDLFQATLKKELEPKEGWKVVKLGTLCDIQNGFAFNSNLFGTEEKGRPLIRIRDIKRGYTETYTTEGCDDAYLVRKGDFLIGMDGEFNIGQWKSDEALLNQRVCKLLPSNKILARFIYYFIPKALKDIEDRTAYATVKHLSSKQIKDISIPYLSLVEQQKIVEVLDAIHTKTDGIIANDQKTLTLCDDLKQSLLRKAFNGEL